MPIRLAVTNEKLRHPSPVIVGLVAAVAAATFVLLRIAAHDGDARTLIRIGDRALPTGVDRPEDLPVVEGLGYDGQYFYRQALDPLSTDRYVEGIELDRPAYRSARIAYPAIVWALSLGGQRDLVQWMMPAVNVLSVGLIGAFGAALARDVGRNCRWGFLFAAWPGFVIGLAYNLAEPLEAALVLAALLALRREHTWVAAAMLTGAVLTRESALIVPAAVIGAALLRAAPRWVPDFVGLDHRGNHLAAGLLPVGAYAGMQWWMTDRWSEDASSPVAKSAEHVSSLPLAQLVRQFSEWASGIDAVDLYHLVQVLLIVLATAYLVTTLIRASGAGTTVERLGFVAALVLVSTLGGWDRMVVYFRWPDLMMMLGFIIYLDADRQRFPTWAPPRILPQIVVLLSVSAVPIWVFI